MIRILIATGIFAPEPGGPATYAKSFADELTHQGYKTAVVTFSNKKKYDADKTLAYPVFRIERKNIIFNYLRYFWEIFKLAGGAPDGGFDVVYAFDYLSAGLPAFLAAKLKGKKLAIRNGGDLLWERHLDSVEKGVTMRDFYEKNLYKKYFFKLAISKFIFRFSDFLIFTTRFQGELFQKYYGIPLGKIKYIENPMPAGAVPVFPKKIGGRRKKEIIWAGRMVHKNNLLRMVDIFCGFHQNNFNLVLIGGGPLKRELEKMVKDKNCVNVIIEKEMENNKLLERISAAYGVVFPAYTDISPRVVLECLFLGAPFILTKEHGFKWLKGNVVEFDPLDNEDMRTAFLKLMDVDYYKSYKKDLLKIKYKYDFKHAVEDTVNLFLGRSIW